MMNLNRDGDLLLENLDSSEYLGLRSLKDTMCFQSSLQVKVLQDEETRLYN